MFTLLTAINPVYSAEDLSIINADVEFNEMPGTILPFSASKNDVEQHGREIYDRLQSGEFGIVGAYVPPPEPAANQPTTTGTEEL